MNRKTFLKTISLMPLTTAIDLNSFGQLMKNEKGSDKMPVLFIGHGSPMNAITENTYSTTWKVIGEKLPRPKAVLCISAHWLTSGTSVAVTTKPQTIHDFGGFPDALFKVQYPAPGAADYAQMAKDNIKSIHVKEDSEWGLDHGAWSVLKNMYPNADIPVFQMSIDYGKSPQYHFNLAKELAFLRKKGVLIIGSGNVVHNLGMLQFDKSEKPYDWSIEFDELVKKSIVNNTPEPLINYQALGKLATLAHPTNDHYLPLMYTLGLRDKTDELLFFNDSFDLGSISMRSVMFS